MDEKTVTMMEGVAREWRVRVMDSAGNVLNPEGFSFYGAAADGVQVPRRMQVRVEGDVVVLVLPGLWMSGGCWRYQVLCQDVLTGVEWVLCQGDVVLERRVACKGPALHEDAVLVDAVLDSEATVMEVVLGDSSAAAAEAARQAVAARAGADEAAARVAGDAARVEELKRVVLDVAAGAALAAERAEGSQRGAEAAAGDAAADAQVAAGKAAEAEVSRVDAEAAAKLAGARAAEAEASAKLAGARAAEAEASAKVAAAAVSDALAARDEAAAARGGAEDAMRAAGARAGEAEDSAEEAGVARAGAEAALGRAEEQAAIATAAAAAAQAPESIAVQAARPATMLLLKDELLSLLGDASLFDIDTDGQKIIVHTDRLADDQLAAVTDMLGRFVPQFIEVVQYNHNMEISWREVTVHVPPTEVNKYDHCTTVNEIEALNPDYKNDLTSDGGWGYALFNLKYGSKGAGQGWNAEGMFKNSLLRKFGLRILPKIQTTVQFFAYSKLEELELELPMATNVGAAFTGDLVGICTNCAELKHAELTIPKASIIVSAFYNCQKLESLTLKGTNATNLESLCRNNKSLSRFWINSPNIDKAKLAFHQCILNKESALHILQKLVTYTDGAEHPITLGIHIDHKYDPEVNLALKKADINYEPTVELPEEVTEGKGWTLTVQWNETPTSTASVMSFGQLIYAKVGEIEYPDGTIEKYLNWGHYVTNWDERGYEQFRSLESAYRYFGLPMPEES